MSFDFKRDSDQSGINSIGRMSIALMLVAAPTLAACAANAEATLQSAADPQAEAGSEREDGKNRVRIVSKGTAIDVDPDTRIHIRGPGNFMTYDIKLQATASARESLKDAIVNMEARLATAGGYEKEALEAALEGMEEALEGLDDEEEAILELKAALEEEGRQEVIVLREVLTDLADEEEQLQSMRIEVTRELADARREIEFAIKDLEIDIEEDDRFAVIQIEALRNAAEELDMNEEEHLRAIERAEEKLKRTRERLEQRIKDRAKEKADEAKQK